MITTKERVEGRFSTTALCAALLAALSLFAGCKDLFHPEGSEDDSTYYTVTFNADGGTPATQTRRVNGGGSAGSSMPSNPTMSGYIFGGWYTSRNGGGSQFTSSTTITANITVYAKWTMPVDILVYELTQNPDYDNYIANLDDFLPDGFTVRTGDQIEISFLIKTGATIPNFSVAIADWANNGDWIATDWDAAKSITADGRFHWCSWTLTAQASGPAGAAPLITQFSMATASVPVVTIYVSDVTVTKLSY